MGEKIYRVGFKCVFVSILVTGMVFALSSKAWAPCFEVDKRCTNSTAPGEPIPFDGYIINCDGTHILYNVTATDDKAGPLNLDKTTLQPNSSIYFSGEYYPESSPSTNTVTATATFFWPGGTTGSITASDTVTCNSPDGIGCRVTGGGVDTAGLDSLSDVYDGTLAEGKSSGSKGRANRYTFGGQAGAFTALQPQPYGEWTHHQQSGPSGRFVFHGGTASAPGTEIDEIVCSDPGGCNPSGDPPSPAKQIDFSGVGTFKNINSEDPMLANVFPGESFHWFEVHIEDLGEPGKGKKFYNSSGCPPEGSGTDAFAALPVFVSPALCECPDFYRIRIFEAFYPEALEAANMEDIIYSVHGYIDGGNLQIHNLTGYDR